jgi:predicted O-methyltransferase YrrM
MKAFDEKLVAQFLASWRSCKETEDLDQLAAAKTTLAEGGTSIALQCQINARYGRFLYVLVRMFRPARIIEIGMANGISSAYIAKAQNTYEKALNAHTIIDPFQSTQWRNAGKALLKRLDLYHNVKVMEDYSYRAVPELEKGGETFHFAFIDGNHCLDYTLSDLLLADRVLHVGGLIVLDDSTDFGVKPAVRYLDRYRHNLKRIRFDAPLAHFFREVTNRRRRLTVYQKVGEDERGADGI